MADMHTEYDGFELLPARLRQRFRYVAEQHASYMTEKNDPSKPEVPDGFLARIDQLGLISTKSDDPLITTASSVLFAYNVQMFLHYNDSIRLHAIDQTAFSPAWRSSEPALYILTRNGRQALATLKLEPALNDLTSSSKVQVQIDEQWVDFENWLYTLPIRQAGCTGHNGYELQFQWWKHNGKHFRIFDVPEEIHLTMLPHCLGVTVDT